MIFALRTTILLFRSKLAQDMLVADALKREFLIR